MKKINSNENILFIRRPKNAVKVLYTFKFLLYWNLHYSENLGIA